jgi:hypothetical protein
MSDVRYSDQAHGDRLRLGDFRQLFEAARNSTMEIPVNANGDDTTPSRKGWSWRW